MPRIALIVIGNEILSGKVEEQNAKYAVRFLREVGADLERVVVVADRLDAIAGEVSRCSDAYDVVITSGGVGPTHDDITYDGIARAFGVSLVEEPRVAGILSKYFGEELTDDHLRMARFPEGAEVHLDEGLPMPVVSIRNVYVFPGIPPLFQACIRAFRKRLEGSPFHVSEVFCRHDEGRIAAALRRIQEAHTDLEIGSYPFRDDQGLFQVRITIEGRDPKDVAEAEAAVREAVGGPPRMT